MKTTLLSAIAICLLTVTSCKKDKAETAGEARDASAPSENAETYNVNTSTSVIEWTGSKQVGKHSGTLRLSGGSIFAEGDQVTGGNFTIDMNTISVSDLEGSDKADLEAHLKGLTMEKADHFFNVRKYPEAKFEITNVSTETGKSSIEGNLTIKETTKNIKFPAIVNISDKSISITSDTFVIDRTEWRVNYGSKSVFTDLTDQFVNDEIEVRVVVKASR